MKLFKMTALTCLLAFTTLTHSTQPSFKDDLRHFASNNSVGYSVLISQKGEVLYQDARGLANVELNVPMQPNHIFEIGSLTKQFTAVAILLLAQDAMLSPEDNISKYIPDISTTKGEVKLKHLLAHTSGLVDPINNPEFLSTRIQEKVSLKKLVGQFKNNHWQYPSGERVNYSNVGYSMLAWVIEQVTESTYENFLTKRIFIPLHMNNTSQASFELTKNKATGYTFNGDTPRQRDLINLNWAYAAADLLSNTHNISVFTHALMQGKILNQQYLDTLMSPIQLKNDILNESSFNTSITSIKDHDAFRMSGSTLGFSCHSIYLPASDSFIVVLSNSDGVNGGDWIPPETVATKLASTLITASK